jgi:leader peptidase (prepilin peptidase)/N-methyltransferase
MFSNTLGPEATRWLAALWLLAVGGAVGSFLNVVVYRLPAGMSIIRPGSRCPMCLHPIRWYDNLPVLGWILLKGRCRDCRGPISLRYPLVEAAVATMFLVVGAVDLFGDHDHLPIRFGRTLQASDGTIVSTWLVRTVPEQCGVDAYHLLLLCTLLAAALMSIDGKRPPWRLFLPVLGVGLLAPVAWPWLHPVPAWPAWATSSLGGLYDSLAGLVAGAALGVAAAVIPPRPGRGWIPADPQQFLLAAAAAGAVLGWQATVVVVVAAVVAQRLFRLAGKRLSPLDRIPATGWLAAAALAWILAWARLVPGP